MQENILAKLSNPEMERAFVGSLFNYQDQIKLVDLSPEDLHDNRHRALFETALEMDAHGEAINEETVYNRLLECKRMEVAGGFAYLTEVLSQPIWSGKPEDYVPALSELAIRRRALREAQEFARAVIDRSFPVYDAINDFSVRIPKLVKTRGTLQHVSVYAGAHYDRMTAAVDNPEEANQRVMKTGMLDFDDITGGLRGGELLLVYGKPGLGKTKWVHQLGGGLARNGYPGAIFQMETSEEEIMDREFSRESGIPAERLEAASLLEEDWPLYTHALERMSAADYPLYLDFKGGWNTVTLRAALTRFKAERGIRWFVVDYLKFLTDVYGKDETERENFLSLQLKRICRDLDIAGTVIHSMNKTGMASKSPELEHGSGGSGISFDCDKALFMIEHEPEREGDLKYEHYRTFVFRKSRRRIKRPVFHMQADKETALFMDVAREKDNAKTYYGKDRLSHVQEVPAEFAGDDDH